jgi:hypothetical protein
MILTFFVHVSGMIAVCCGLKLMAHGLKQYYFGGNDDG